MKKWLKRIRGALGTGFTWAAAWSVVGTTMWWAVSLLFLGGPAVGPVVATMTFLATFGVVGFIAGGIFSVVLGISERRRTFDEMSLPRFAAWGGLGGLLLSAFVFVAESGQMAVPEFMILAVLPLLGAASAAGSLALARVESDREVLAAEAEAADLGHTGAEAREILLP